MNSKIHLIGPFRKVEHPAHAANTIYPGMLLELLSTNDVQPHSVAGGFAERMFAQEDALQGNTATTVYANAADPVQIAYETPGSLGLGLLKAGYAYTVGMKLISAGDGTLKPTTGSPSQIMATVIDALDLSASGTSNTLSQIRYK